ncbi:unnamed protein product [Boreogadus saida]
MLVAVDDNNRSPVLCVMDKLLPRRSFYGEQVTSQRARFPQKSEDIIGETCAAGINYEDILASSQTSISPKKLSVGNKAVVLGGYFFLFTFKAGAMPGF